MCEIEQLRAKVHELKEALSTILTMTIQDMSTGNWCLQRCTVCNATWGSPKAQGNGTLKEHHYGNCWVPAARRVLEGERNEQDNPQ